MQKMNKITLIVLLATCFTRLSAQTIEEFYRDKNYKEVVKFEKDTSKLTGQQCYMMAYANFRLENDAKAVEMYDKALEKGLTEGYVYFYKSLALQFQKKMDEAFKNINKSIELEPNNQEYWSELGLMYFNKGETDKALDIYMKAQKMPNTFQSPFYMVGHIHQTNQDFDKALSAFYTGLDSLSEDNEFYLKTIMDIGKLEYTHSKNFKKSSEAYSKALVLYPDDYKIHPKLMKAYNAADEFAKADSVFAVMKNAYEKGKLPEDYKRFKSVAIDEFMWQGQMLNVYKYFTEPKKSLDVMYKVYLLTKEGDKVERTFLTEKTLDLGALDDTKHLFCETERNGGHRTYPLGWSTDTIPLKSLRGVVVRVLEEKMAPAASSKMKKN
jgi:tetratricopeptide (TPR) repeat protein